MLACELRSIIFFIVGALTAFSGGNVKGFTLDNYNHFHRRVVPRRKTRSSRNGLFLSFHYGHDQCNSRFQRVAYCAIGQKHHRRGFAAGKSLCCLQTTAKDDEDNDGTGWDDDDNDTKAPVFSQMKDSDKLLLRQLQEDQQQKMSPANNGMRITEDGEKGEPDLFIPIFSLVAIMGLLGAYGYETLRLYSRGELYLPWN